MQSNTLFLKTSPLKLFLLVSIPGAISMLASALYQTLDGVFVGHFLGPTAFAAVNLAMPFVIINFSLADLIGVGASVPISISLGRKQNREANNIFTCACLLIVGTGVLIGAVLYAAAPLLIRLMGAEGEFADLAVQYIRVYALCSPVTTIVFAMDNFLRICGIIRGSMFLNILMSVLSGVLEFLFLAVFRWGIWAAALATCTGMFISAFLAVVPFLRGKTLLRFCKPRFQTVSVYGILMYADGFIQPLLYGMCDSLQPAVGYNWGAGKFARVRAIEKCCFSASGLVSLLAVLVIALFPEQITLLFMADAGQDVMGMAVGALRLFSLTYVVRWFSFATQSYMLAIEKSLPASIISVSTALVFPLILVILLWPLGLTGIWLNFAGTAVLAAVLSGVILLKMHRELSRPESPAPPPPNIRRTRHSHAD